MAVDTIARGLAIKSGSDIISDLEDGSIIVARAYEDQNGVNIDEYYAKIADVPYISTDFYPYTSAEIDSLLGVG